MHNNFTKRSSIHLILFSVVFLIPILFSCSDTEKGNTGEIGEEIEANVDANVELDRPVTYYHWKSELDLSDLEQKQLQSLGCQKIYLRLFDLKWVASQNQVFPFAALKISNESNLSGLKYIVPTVYITNESLINTPLKDLESLASQVKYKMDNATYPLTNKGMEIVEYHFDCDWSDQTKDKYFAFLELIKEKFNNEKNITCTIRLHQVKYFEKTGVPPVSKGVLMFYNMGNIRDLNEKNSILNLETAKKYLENFDKYPLKLDIALPLFSWGVQYREEKIVQILNNVHKTDMEVHDQMKVMGEGKFRVQESTYIEGNFVYKDDVIKLEGPSLEDLKESLRLLDDQISGDPEIIFYHLNQQSTRNYPPEVIADIVKK